MDIVQLIADGKQTGHNVIALHFSYQGPCRIVLIEDFPCQNFDQLTAREQHHIDLNKAICVNKLRAKDLRTDEERKANKAQYQQDNKEQIAQQKKQYYQDNKEHFLQQRLQHYQDNKEQVNQRKKEKVQCECGSIISRGNVADHRKSRKHLAYVH